MWKTFKNKTVIRLNFPFWRLLEIVLMALDCWMNFWKCSERGIKFWGKEHKHHPLQSSCQCLNSFNILVEVHQLYASCGFHNKLQQTWWLKITEFYSFFVLVARSPKSTSQQGHAPYGNFRDKFFQCVWILVVVSFPGLWSPHSQICFHFHITFSSVPVFSSVCLL